MEQSSPLSAAVEAALAKSLFAQARLQELKDALSRLNAQKATPQCEPSVVNSPTRASACAPQSDSLSPGGDWAARIGRLGELVARLETFSSPQRTRHAGSSLPADAGHGISVDVAEDAVNESARNENARFNLLSPRSRAFDDARRAAARVPVFVEEGAPMPTLPVATLGLSTGNRAAAICEERRILFLGDSFGEGDGDGSLTAVDLVSGSPHWTTPPGLLGHCGGIGVLPPHPDNPDGPLLIVATSTRDETAHVFTGDGEPVASVPVSTPGAVAVDALRSTVYIASRDCVEAFIWDAARGQLAPLGVLEAAGSGGGRARLVAFVPPAHLVVGEVGGSTLRVVGLPSAALELQHALEEGVELGGIAGGQHGDGAALAVRDTSAGGAVHVLTWPLPGMRA